MKNLYLLILISVLVFSCEDIVTHHLNKGLDELEHSRPINQELIQGYTVEKVGFFKLNDSTLKVAIKLNGNISSEMVETYSLAIQIQPESEFEKNLPKNKNYISWDIQPELEVFNENKYIIFEQVTSIKKIKRIRLALYNRGRYQKSYGDDIIIKNIGW